MSYSVDNIIPIQTFISSAGLANANFASAMLFAPAAETPEDFTADTYRTYSSLRALSVDFGTGTETYLAASKWLGGIPTMRKLVVWSTAADDANTVATLNKAANVTWWYWSFFTKAVYAEAAQVLAIASWHDNEEKFFMNCQTGTAVTAIRTEATTTDIASQLTTQGTRHVATFTHATDPYAGIALCKWFAAVNYTGTNTTITGEFKTLAGVASESLKDTEYAAMTKDTKKALFYTDVELQGSTDSGRTINSWSHSSYGEFIDDIVNLDAFVNTLKVNLYNALAGVTTKLAQTPVGQSVLIGAARAACQQYIENNYLGPRNYTDPDDGVYKYTAGYQILTKPEDILDLSDADRSARKAALIQIRVFRAGAIHQAPVDVTVY